MRSSIGAGIVGGLVAGALTSLILSVMQMELPSGDQLSIMTIVAGRLAAGSFGLAWVYHLLAGALLGALWSLLVGRRGQDHALAVGLGLGWGLLVWIVWALNGLPVLLGLPPFGWFRSLDMVPVAIGTLLAFIAYGAALGAAVALLRRPGRGRAAGEARRTA